MFNIKDVKSYAASLGIKEAVSHYHRCEGYLSAIDDYGIWKNGKQVIGCMEKPVSEISKNIRLHMAEYLKVITKHHNLK